MLLLLPGALGRPETSFEYIAALETEWRILAPGYPATIGTMTGLANGIAALLNACGITRAHVVGGSFGGLVAQVLLDRFPERVERLVLSDTSPPVPARVVRMRASAALIHWLPELIVRDTIEYGVERYVGELPAEGRRFWQEHFREMLTQLTRTEIENRARAWAEFDTLRGKVVPGSEVLLLSTASDRAVSPKRFQHLFPEAVVHVVDSPLGHAASVGDAQAYITPIQRFLKEGKC